MNEVDEKLANAYLIASGKAIFSIFDHGESGEVRWVVRTIAKIPKMIQFHNDRWKVRQVRSSRTLIASSSSSEEAKALQV